MTLPTSTPQSRHQAAARTGAQGPAGLATAGKRLTIGLFVVAVFLYWFSQYVYMPTLPVYVQGKAPDLAVVGAVLSMYGLWQLIVRLPIGIAADWWGRRQPFIVGGIVVAAAGALLMARGANTGDLMAGRALTGVSAGAWAPMVAAFCSLFPAGQAVQASALITLVNSLGRIVGTGVNGVLTGQGGYVAPFVAAAAASLVAAAVMLPVREQRRPAVTFSPAHLGRLLARRELLLPSVLAAVAQYALWGVAYGFLPILAKQFGASDGILGLLATLNVALNIVGNLAVTGLARRVGSRRLSFLSFLLWSAGLGIAALAGGLSAVVAAQVCMGLAHGISYPVLMGLSVQRIAENERTTAVSFFQAVYALGMFAGPAASGVLAGALGIQPMFALTAAAVALAGCGGTRYLRE